MAERFELTELMALRNAILESGIDSGEAGELMQVFLMAQGYGVSPEAAGEAAFRIENADWSITVLQRELSNLALVM